MTLETLQSGALKYHFSLEIENFACQCQKVFLTLGSYNNDEVLKSEQAGLLKKKYDKKTFLSCRFYDDVENYVKYSLPIYKLTHFVLFVMKKIDFHVHR